MPELPDIENYVEALAERVVGRPLLRLTVHHPFLLRSAAPRPEELAGREVRGVRRLGKRIVLAFEGELFAALHLMIAGRLIWKEGAPPAPPAPRSRSSADGTAGNAERFVRPRPQKGLLATWLFPSGTLRLTEAGTQRRAALHLLAGEAALAGLDGGGLEPLEADLPAFERRLRQENHTVKRALTDPRLFAGIGNAYSDEILHAARLSPLKLTGRLTTEEVACLHEATRRLLREWTGRLRAERAGGFPARVTAFHPGMAVHGRHGKPCPVCGTPVQRIRYAENECNYCPGCQTGGQLYADRALSRLLKGDWPRTVEELERLRRPRGD